MHPRVTSIRFLLVVATIGVSVLVALLLLPFANRQVEAGFDAFEAGYAEQERQRLELMLQASAATLARTAIDYSRWDETVEYIAGARPQWIDDNLTQDVFDNFNVETIVVADRALGLVGVRMASDDHAPGDLDRLIRRGGTCDAAIDQRIGLHRFEIQHGVPHVVVCTPVYAPSPAEAAVVGVMVWTMALNAPRVAEIEKLVQFPFVLERASSGGDSSSVLFGGSRIAVQTPVKDWNGQSVLTAKMELPRPLGAQRDLTTRMMLVLMVAALASPPFLILVLLEIYVVRRIRHMSQWVRAARLGESARQDRPLAAPSGRAGFAELAMLRNDFADLTERLESSRAGWREEALRDSLTGLGSRTRMLGDLAPVLARGEAVALMLVDLDGFKAVNDMLGHPAGDVLLQEVAQRLITLVPTSASTYRLGGDEFAVVSTAHAPAALATLARHVCDGLRIVRHAAGKSLSITACAGASVSSAGEGLTVSQLIAHADLALYEAKRSGRDSYRLFSAATHASYRENLELEAGLRTALAESRIAVWYQPIVDAKSGETLAVEALARWHEPALGWISPARFVDIAEHARLINALDFAVMGVAMRAFTAMRALRPAMHLHVNLSAQTVAGSEFIPQLDTLLAATGMPGDALRVELTESDLSIRPEHLQDSLARLRERGLKLVVDDFGVGASSLGRLAQVRPSAVKIDGSFVLDIHGDGGRICRAIVELARELGMASVAEYVEGPEHTRALRAMGCDALQGFGISRPLPAPELLKWLADNPISPHIGDTRFSAAIAARRMDR